MSERKTGPRGYRECGKEFDRHPAMPRLVAICTRPTGHEGGHNNVLPKRVGDPGAPAPTLRVVKDGTR